MATGDITAGVDWITATSAGGGNSLAQTVYCRHLLSAEVARGNPREPWGSHGYLGWHAGRVDFGQRGDELIVRVQSARAEDCYQAILDLGMRPSRIDLALTIWTGTANLELARKGRDTGREFQRKSKNPIRVDYYDASDGDGTLYLGSWKSETFGRLYDRGAKTKLEADRDAWRYEVVRKNEGAVAVGVALGAVSDRHALIRDYVCSYYGARGVPVRVPDNGRAVHIDSRVERTDDDRKLTWLEEQVAPSVKELIERRGLSTVVTALELEGYIWQDRFARAVGPPLERWQPRLEDKLWPRTRTTTQSVADSQ